MTSILSPRNTFAFLDPNTLSSCAQKLYKTLITVDGNSKEQELFQLLPQLFSPYSDLGCDTQMSSEELELIRPLLTPNTDVIQNALFQLGKEANTQIVKDTLESLMEVDWKDAAHTSSRSAIFYANLASGAASNQMQLDHSSAFLRSAFPQDQVIRITNRATLCIIKGPCNRKYTVTHCKKFTPIDFLLFLRYNKSCFY